MQLIAELRRPRLHVLLSLLSLLPAAARSLSAPEPTPADEDSDEERRNIKPNLVFAMIDDWGFYEVGFRGNTLAQTPFIDKMIGESLLIERHYSYRYCSPARRSFLSGRLPPHVGQTNSPDATIDLRMDTIANKLAAAGYITGHSGKVSSPTRHIVACVMLPTCCTVLCARCHGRVLTGADLIRSGMPGSSPCNRPHTPGAFPPLWASCTAWTTGCATDTAKTADRVTWSCR